jgi:hypothetical protein
MLMDGKHNSTAAGFKVTIEVLFNNGVASIHLTFIHGAFVFGVSRFYPLDILGEGFILP